MKAPTVAGLARIPAITWPKIGPALIAILMIAGAVCFGIILQQKRDYDDNTVVIVPPANMSRSSGGRTIVDQLTRTPGFNWRIVSAADKPRLMARRWLPFAAVIVADENGPSGISAGRLGQPVTVLPGLARSTDKAYVGLTQAVYESVSRARIAEILDAVSDARVSLNVASFTGAGMDGALAQASSSLEQSTRGFNELLARSMAMLETSRVLLDAYRPAVGVITGLAARLTEFSAGIRSLDVTLGDLKGGAELSQRAVNYVFSILPQFEEIGLAFSGSLQHAYVPGLQTLGDQIAVVLKLVSGGRGRSGSMDLLDTDELSALVGAHVDENTTVADFVSASADRLRSVVGFFNDAGRTFDEAFALATNSRATFTETRGEIARKLEDFRRVMAHLNSSINTATGQLPSFSNSNGGLVRVDERLLGKADGLLRASYVLLMGALTSVCLMASICRADGRVCRFILWLTASIALAVVVGLGFVDSGHFGSVFAVSALAAFVAIAVGVVLVRLFGRWGFVAAGAIVIADLVVGNLSYMGKGFINAVENVLPSSCFAEMLRASSVWGVSLSDVAVLLPLAVGAPFLIASLYRAPDQQAAT